LFSYDDNHQYEHPSLLIRSIEQDRYECTRYLFDHHLLQSKLDINITNSQGRHCLLMLTHKNGPIDLIKYLLTNHLSCLDMNKLDLNKFSSLHHACRHFNLSVCELLLPYINKKLFEIDNSELHTPLDYWIECLCSLKKLKPTNIQHHSDTLRLDYLLNDIDYHSNALFFQTIINHGGQLTKLPLRYIRSILPQLTFEQKLSYVDHHVNLCCTLYKNRLSTLIRDYDNLKISIQAGEILTEFIYALGTVQLEIQNRLATHNTYSNVYETTLQRLYRDGKTKEQKNLQIHMRMLCFKFFRLFQCIYNNPDVDVKNFHFEHIFRRVWIYWKEPVRVFIAQCREKNSTLKSICRIVLFKRLIHYPADIQHLPINPALKQFVAYDNQFFVVQRKY
jgi:ankyrin repeat protein